MPSANLQTSQGQPPDTLGVNGDMCWDYQGRFYWGPKGNVTAGSWVGTATNSNPQFASPVATPNLSAGYGPACCFNAQTMGTSTSGPNIAFYQPGTTQPHIFQPQQNCTLTQITATNYGATGATVYFYLQNLTTGQAVASWNAGNGIASGTIASAAYNVALVAGNQYQFQGIRASAGSTTMVINPVYTVPTSNQGSSVTFYPTSFVVTSSTNYPAGQGGLYMQAAGISGQQNYMRNQNASYLYAMQLTIAGSGNIHPFFWNTSANSLAYDGLPTFALTSTPTTYNYGPFGGTVSPFAAATNYSLGLYNATGGATVTSAVALLQIGQ